ncbi:MAG TPA: maleylpyruvate isomerase N-terminal domain-containing protein [Streptosporangiaceae bacterium]
MTSLDSIRSALGQSYTAIENLCAALSPAQWQAQSLCPDWTVRAVVSHLASIEQMLAGWRPGSAGELPPFDRVTAFAQQTAALDDAAFAARVAQTFGQRRADLAALSEGRSRPSVLDADRAGHLRLVHGYPRLRLLGARARYHYPARPAGRRW